MRSILARRSGRPRMDAINQPLLDVVDLSVAFHQPSGTSVAVDRISFQIKPGECVALVGESGSGKSVSALSILKLLPYPTASHPSGSIRFKGRELLTLSEREIRSIRGNDISIIFQEPMTSLNPLHTIESQIGEILQLHSGISGPNARARTLELLRQVGIPEPETRLASYPHQLSGGQRQRVMIAMALANEPDLLIADEPTTALDVTVQAQILTLLAEIRSRLGMSLLFITHDLGIVRRIADVVCVMNSGKIVEQGPVEQVFTAPQHPYTRALLAAEPKPDPAPPRPESPVVISADDLKVWFPVKRGLLRSTVGGRWCQPQRAQGRNPRRRRGIRLRQDHAGTRAVAADFIRWADCVFGKGHPGPAVQGDAAVPARYADRVPGPVRRTQPANVGWRYRCRRPDRASEGAVV
jgi:microcin C transport system ATP-binding protein